MITFDIIRGHKLVLWADRLDFVPEFVEQIDKFGVNYIQEIQQSDKDEFTVILYTKLKDKDAPFPVIFQCSEEQLNSLVEKFQVAPYTPPLDGLNRPVVVEEPVEDTQVP